jgi:hypothetical protein
VPVSRGLELPPVGTRLRATYKGQELTAEIVSDPARPHKRAVRLGEVIYRTLSGAAVAATGHSTNGWKFWKREDGSDLD